MNLLVDYLFIPLLGSLMLSLGVLPAAMTVNSMRYEEDKATIKEEL